MLSRSSSNYQPLESVVEVSSCNAKDAHEMTNISVISSHPMSSENNGVHNNSNKAKPQVNGKSNMVVNLVDEKESRSKKITSGIKEFLKCFCCCFTCFCCCCQSERTRNSTAEKTQWTNFHFVMCIGMFSFFAFWIVLLCRMYLPEEYRFWT